MELINQELLEEKIGDILEFFRINKDMYNESQYLLYRRTVLLGNLLDFHLLQIYAKFGILNECRDPYKNFLKLLNYYNFLNTNCCEVASGKYPILGEMVSTILKENGKSLTIYEPNIMTNELNNVTIKKEDFTKQTDISHIDTLYGTFACDATIPVVEKALEEDKNLLLSLCACDHSCEKYPLRKGNHWADDFCEEIKEEYGNEISILSWPSTVELDLPIILRMNEQHKRLNLKI